jgi:hypothetical protein
MSHGTEQIATIFLAIVGVAILAVLVSKNSNTAQVIKAAGQTFSESLSVAVSPITGRSGAGSANYNY